MTVAVDKAKTMWCPMVRAANGRQASNCTVNMTRILQDSDDNRCIADGCMMWRWDGDRKLLGHCGLAGAP